MIISWSIFQRALALFIVSTTQDTIPLWKPQNTTVLSSIHLNGETAYATYSGGTTSERFVDYLRNILIPTLSPDSIVVMDNMP